MKREVMKQTVEGIVADAKDEIISVEEASEKIVKVFEQSLEESIGEATKMFPKSLFAGLSKEVKK